MSLVNKMLRDLDARRVGEGERAALPVAVTPLAAHLAPSRVLPRLLLGAVALVAVLGAAAWYGTQPPSAPAAPVLAVAPTPAPAVTPAAAPPAASAAAEAVRAPLAIAVTHGAPSLRMADELSARMPEPAPSRKPAAAAPTAVQPKTVEPKTVEPKTSASVASRPPVAAPGKSPPIPVESRIDKHERLPSAAERGDGEYRRAVQAQRQGNVEQALAGYRTALENYPEHAAARQTLAAQLIEARHFDEAEDLLRKGTELASVRLASTLALARLKVERNQAPSALELLQKHAASGERSAEYQGFFGALLNRAGRTAEAVEHYQAATRLAPSEGRWWAGLGIALDAAGKGPEAGEAYQKARALPGLPADLAQHVEQRLR
ncbi:MAG: hypothetical protein Q8O52_03540 [Sulfuritalea sp.]|nr:hypothetical protein [Sulfuritalea sp.]